MSLDKRERCVESSLLSECGRRLSRYCYAILRRSRRRKRPFNSTRWAEGEGGSEGAKNLRILFPRSPKKKKKPPRIYSYTQRDRALCRFIGGKYPPHVSSVLLRSACMQRKGKRKLERFPFPPEEEEEAWRRRRGIKEEEE